MKTQYRILWVDDDLESVTTDISDVKDFFERFGIEPNIITFESRSEIDIYHDIKKELVNPDLDLIVVDYLMEGMNGRQLIDTIRETDHIFLPVVFYSSAGSEELHRQAAEASLDGVYITHRDRVRDKVEIVAASLLRKEQTSKRTRGLLMEGVSEIDANFGQLFLLFWDKLDDAKKSELAKYLKEKITKGAASKNKLAETLPIELPDFRAYMEERFVSGIFDTITRWKILKKLFGLLNITGGEVDVFHRLFDKKDGIQPLIPLRNQYGHRTRADLEKSHNEEMCISIRRELRIQTKNIGLLSSDKFNDG